MWSHVKELKRYWLTYKFDGLLLLLLRMEPHRVYMQLEVCSFRLSNWFRIVFRSVWCLKTVLCLHWFLHNCKCIFKSGLVTKSGEDWVVSSVSNTSMCNQLSFLVGLVSDKPNNSQNKDSSRPAFGVSCI